jgi:N-methylhydantoinase B/oxoprolinase/acetone carboxylase alpha subunit
VRCRRAGSATFDFSGTGPEVYGNLNAPPAVAYSAIIYSLRCLVTRDIPLNQGCLAPIKVRPGGRVEYQHRAKGEMRMMRVCLCIFWWGHLKTLRIVHISAGGGYGAMVM